MKILAISRASKRYKNQTKKIEQKNLKNYQKHLQSLIIMTQELKKKIFTYNQTLKIHKLKQQLFQIDQQKHNKGEITPSEYLKKKIIYQFDKMRLNEMHQELIILKNKLILKSKNTN